MALPVPLISSTRISRPIPADTDIVPPDNVLRYHSPTGHQVTASIHLPAGMANGNGHGSGARRLAQAGAVIAVIHRWICLGFGKSSLGGWHINLTIQTTNKRLAGRDSARFQDLLPRGDRTRMGQPEGGRRHFDPFNGHREWRCRPVLLPLTPTGTHLSRRSDPDTADFTGTVKKAHTTTNEQAAPRSCVLPRREPSMRPV